jgi:chaperonin GroES
MTIKLKPLSNRVVIKPIEDDNTTAGGIFIPDTAKEKPHRGRVIAVGPGSRNYDGNHYPIELCENDIVLFPKHAGNKIKIEGEELIVLKEEELLAVFENKFSSIIHVGEQEQ